MLARVADGTWRRMTEVFKFVLTLFSFAFLFFSILLGLHYYYYYLLFKLYTSKPIMASYLLHTKFFSFTNYVIGLRDMSVVGW